MASFEPGTVDGEGVSALRLRRRERERRQRRAEILAAAESVFARKGYHGAMIEEIAQEAELAVGTIYNFFGGKESLYEEVLRSLAEDFLGRYLAEVVSIDDPLAAIRGLVELRLRHIGEHSGFARVLFGGTSGGWPDPFRVLPESCLEIHDRYFQHGVDILARGIENGALEPGDPVSLMVCIDGIVDGFVGHWIRHGEPGCGEVCIEEVVRMVLRAIGSTERRGRGE